MQDLLFRIKVTQALGGLAAISVMATGTLLATFYDEALGCVVLGTVLIPGLLLVNRTMLPK